MKFINTLKSRNGRPVDFEEVEFGIEDICKRFNILLLYIFGSYASSGADKLSDLDIAYLPARKLDLDKTLDLLSELQDIFEEEAIDFVDINTAPLALTHRILRDGKCLYASSLAIKIEFEMKREHLYYDTIPLRREYFEAMKRRIENGSFGYR